MTKTYETTARISACELTLEAGESTVFNDFAAASPAAVSVHPGAGASALVELSTSLPSRVAAGTARWLPAGVGANGVVSAPEGLVLDAPLTALRITASVGPVAVEVVQ